MWIQWVEHSKSMPIYVVALMLCYCCYCCFSFSHFIYWSHFDSLSLFFLLIHTYILFPNSIRDVFSWVTNFMRLFFIQIVIFFFVYISAVVLHKKFFSPPLVCACVRERENVLFLFTKDSLPDASTFRLMHNKKRATTNCFIQNAHTSAYCTHTQAYFY